MNLDLHDNSNWDMTPQIGDKVYTYQLETSGKGTIVTKPTTILGTVKVRDKIRYILAAYADNIENLDRLEDDLPCLFNCMLVTNLCKTEAEAIAAAVKQFGICEIRNESM